MYRLVFTYKNTSLGNAYDDICDLDYTYFEDKDINYVYENLDFNMLIDLVKRDLIDLTRVEKGVIHIELMGD